jgi:type 1 glutamine amidotransferase
MTKALVVYGGWEGHKPAEMAAFQGRLLEEAGIQTTVTNSLDALANIQRDGYQLVVPVWTMEHLEPHLASALLDAVRAGVGLATLHGVIDSFRQDAEFHYMLGGQWVTHFEFTIRTYDVTFTKSANPLTEGLSDFEVTTEQYYLLVDPANDVLATMQVDSTRMPVAWTKSYGTGRVFYCSLGHSIETVSHPSAQALIQRGMSWAAGVG